MSAVLSFLVLLFGFLYLVAALVFARLAWRTITRSSRRRRS